MTFTDGIHVDCKTKRVIKTHDKISEKLGILMTFIATGNTKKNKFKVGEVMNFV